MMDWTAAADALAAKLHPDAVKTRKQAGRDVAYVEGWHVIAEANRIFGFGEWMRETLDMRCVGEHERTVGAGSGWGVTYTARVRVTVAGVIRDGCGAGHGIDRDIGQAHESALKEAETDAMKRAFMTFGNPFGLALYDKYRENVGVDRPKFNAPAAAKRISVAIAKADTLAALAAVWKDERSTVADIKADSAGEYDLLAEQKDKRKAALAGTEFMQGAG